MIVSNQKLQELLDKAEPTELHPGFARKTVIVPSVEFGEIRLMASMGRCQSCGTGNLAPYMVRDEVWSAAGFREGLACVRCVQARLGRRLTLDDFADLPVNEIVLLLRENRDAARD